MRRVLPRNHRRATSLTLGAVLQTKPPRQPLSDHGLGKVVVVMNFVATQLQRVSDLDSEVMTTIAGHHEIVRRRGKLVVRTGMVAAGVREGGYDCEPLLGSVHDVA